MREALARSPHGQLSFLAFLLYLLVITSYRIPLGDVAVLLALVGVAISKSPIQFPTWFKLFTAFTVWSTLSALASPFPDEALQGSIDLVKLWLIVLVACNSLLRPEQIRVFLVFFLGCFALFPLRGTFVTFFLWGDALEGRALWVGLFRNSNDLAAIALLQMSMTVFVMVTSKRGWVRHAAMAGTALIPLLILATQSRACFIGLALFTAMAFFGLKRRLKALVYLGGLAIVLAMAAPDGVWDRVGGLMNATSVDRLDQVDQEGSASQRFAILVVAVRVIREYPVMGTGVTAYNSAHARAAPDPRVSALAWGRHDTHNTYLRILAETGIPGFVLFMWMLASVIVPAWDTRRRARRRFPRIAYQLLLLEAGLFAYMIAGVFHSHGYLPFIYLHLALMSSLTRIHGRELQLAGRTPRRPRPVHPVPQPVT